MKRLAAFVALGVLICAAAYGAAYFFGTAPARRMAESKAPELGWLKQEFNLSDAEFARVCELHYAYQPRCAEMCRRIEAKNAEVREALAHADQLTPEVRQKLAEAAQLRAECQQAMLQHFFEVSRSMPPEQGKRYLAWVEGKTFDPMQGMAAPSTARHHEHGDQ
jgi:hypothetical protein